MKEITHTVYEAFDGTQFPDYHTCVEYEQVIKDCALAIYHYWQQYEDDVICRNDIGQDVEFDSDPEVIQFKTPEAANAYVKLCCECRLSNYPLITECAIVAGRRYCKYNNKWYNFDQLEADYKLISQLFS